MSATRTSVQDTYCTYGLIWPTQITAVQQIASEIPPKLPNVPTYGQLNPAFSCTIFLEQGQGQKKAWCGGPDSVIIGIRGRQSNAQLTDSLPGLNFHFLFGSVVFSTMGTPCAFIYFNRCRIELLCPRRLASGAVQVNAHAVGRL
jgi:hypothetical protein